MAEKLQPGKISGELSAAGFRFGIVVSRFNSFITERLLAAAVDGVERASAARKDVDVVEVPRAFELPLAAKKMGATGEDDEVIGNGELVCDADVVPMGHEPAGFHQAGSEILEKREGRGHDARFREQTF